MPLRSDTSKNLTIKNKLEKKENVTYLNLRSNEINKLSDENITVSSPIQEFYENQTIFITGATGFIGKVLLEKLLRSCSGITKIYVMVREKKGKGPDERIQELLGSTVFDTVRSRDPNFAKKVIGLAGDCSNQNFGLSNNDIQLLKKEVSIVFHCAATVRFDETLKIAVATNIQSTITITEMCKEMKNLKAFIYVSTAFAHCLNITTIEEKFYDYPINHKDLFTLVNSLPDKTIETITPSLLEKHWINTYTCTKAITENYLKNECYDLPVAIFRPAIVASTAYEPIPGWADNFNGVTGVCAGVTSGVLRALQCDPNKQANVVPVDFTVNALIATAWDVMIQETRRGNQMLIYNYNSPKEAPLTWRMLSYLGIKYNRMFPLSMTLWYPSIRLIKYDFVYKFYRLFLHSIPASLIDFLAKITGRKPQMKKIYDRIDKMNVLMKPVITREWEINNEQIQSLWNKMEASDQKLFRFSMQNFNWDKFFLTFMKGLRIHLFKDSWNTLEDSRYRLKKLYFMNLVLRIILIVSVYYTGRKVMQRRKPDYNTYHLYT